MLIVLERGWGRTGIVFSVPDGIPTGELPVQLLPDPGSLLGLAVLLEGFSGAEEAQRFDLAVVNEHPGNLEVVGSGRFVIHAVHGNVCEGHVEAGLDGAVGFKIEAFLGGCPGLFPLLESNQGMALVQIGIGFPEVFLFPGEKEGEGFGGGLEFPGFEAGLGEVAPDEGIGLLRVVRCAGQAEEAVGTLRDQRLLLDQLQRVLLFYLIPMRL